MYDFQITVWKLWLWNSKEYVQKKGENSKALDVPSNMHDDKYVEGLVAEKLAKHSSQPKNPLAQRVCHRSKERKKEERKEGIPRESLSFSNSSIVLPS